MLIDTLVVKLKFTRKGTLVFPKDIGEKSPPNAAQSLVPLNALVHVASLRFDGPPCPSTTEVEPSPQSLVNA
jgi:hypothetical protein